MLAAGGTSLTIDNSTFSQNTASFAGGGLFNAAANTSITTSNFTNNAGPFTGGIFNGDLVAADTPSLTASNVNVTGNTSTVLGGGVAVGTSATLGWTGGQIGSNTAVSGGGLYVLAGGQANVTNATITSNTASTGIGGGIVASGAVTLDGVQVTLNKATPNASNANGNGGGMVVSGQVIVRTSTFSQNSAAGGANTGGFGCGIHAAKLVAADMPSLQVEDSIFQSNTGVDGGALSVFAGTGASITRTQLLQHAASFVGGAIFNAGSSSVTNAVLSSNSGVLAGGAVYNGSTVATDTPAMTVTDSTISTNSTQLLGGGVAKRDERDVHERRRLDRRQHRSQRRWRLCPREQQRVAHRHGAA